MTGDSKGQCYDYEVRFYCERGLRLQGNLFTGRYGDENEEGNRLKGKLMKNSKSLFVSGSI